MAYPPQSPPGPAGPPLPPPGPVQGLPPGPYPPPYTRQPLPGAGGGDDRGNDLGGAEKDLDHGGARIEADSSQSRCTAAARWQPGVEDIAHHEFAHALGQSLEAEFGAGTGSVRQWVVKGFAEWVALRSVTGRYRHPGRLDGQLREAVGMGTSQFQAAWATYVRSHS